jgi:hypothetical protein
MMRGNPNEATIHHTRNPPKTTNSPCAKLKTFEAR